MYQAVATFIIQILTEAYHEDKHQWYVQIPPEASDELSERFVLKIVAEEDLSHCVSVESFAIHVLSARCWYLNNSSPEKFLIPVKYKSQVQTKILSLQQNQF